MSQAYLNGMSSQVLYSTNPWFAVDIATRYRKGVHFAWVCEYFDARMAPPGSAAAMIAPSSSPCRIYRNLLEDSAGADGHSALIKGYRKTFSRLAKEWLSDGTLTQEQYDEIIASVRRGTMKIWRPVLYVIPRLTIVPSSRILSVPHRSRASYGPELQIRDLHRHEFDVIELDIT